MSLKRLPKDITARHPFWITWRNMRRRCNNSYATYYENYGARGIRVCERWEKFQNFYDDMFAAYSTGMTIERLDNNKNYEPLNCTWIPKTEQSKNRRNVRRFYGKTLPEWAKELGIKQSTLEMRYYAYKWDIKRCLETPVKRVIP